MKIKSLILAGLLLASAAWAQSPPSQAAGYQLAWQDNFATRSLTTENVPGYNWYNPGVWLEVSDPPQEITDPHGTYVNLNWVGSSGSGDYTNIGTASPSGAYYRSWTYGYFEVSMAFDPATGSWPALWMLPVSTIGNPGRGLNGGELDIFEWQSNSPTVFNGNLHVWANGTQTGGVGIAPTASGIKWSNFNTYGVLWTPTQVCWYLNNASMGCESTTASPFNTVFGGQEPYFLVLSQQAGCNWDLACSGQVSPLNMQVRWVHVFTPPGGSVTK